MSIVVATRRSCSPVESSHTHKRLRTDDPINTLELADEFSHPIATASAQAGPSVIHFEEADLVEEQMASPVEFRKTYAHELDYRNKLVLAPMVRTGSCELATPLIYRT